MLDMNRDERDSTFRHKYNDVNAHRGTDAQIKHTNRVGVQKNIIINQSNVYEKTVNFFEKLINKNVWQASRLKEFLNKMSQLEGMNHQSTANNTDSALDINLSQTLSDISTMKSDLQIIFTKLAATSSVIVIDQTTIGNHHFDMQENIFKQELSDAQQMLQKRIQSVNLSELSNGLEVANIQIDEIHSRLNRVANEKLFSKKISQAKQRIKISSEMPKENLSKKILKKQNLKFLSNKEKTEINDKLVKFPDCLTFISKSIQFDAFNNQPNERTLLKLGWLFIKEHCNQTFKSKDGEINKIDLKDHSAFMAVYLKNLKHCNFDRIEARELIKQKETNQVNLIEISSLTNKENCVDLLIRLNKSLEEEYVRHRLIIWTTKTIECIEKHNKKSVSNNKPDGILNLKSNLVLLRSNDCNYKSLSLLLEFQLENILEILMGVDELKNLTDKVEKFYEKSSCVDRLLQIFDAFSKLKIFHSVNEYFNFISIREQVKKIEDFLFVLAHNLKFMSFTANDYDNVYCSFERIEIFLYSLPYSYLHDLVFKFAMFIEANKLGESSSVAIKDPQSLGNKLIICYKEHNINELRKVFRNRGQLLPNSFDLQKTSLNQLLTTFLSLAYYDLTEAIVDKVAAVPDKLLCSNRDILKPDDAVGPKFVSFLSVLLENCAFFSLENLKRLLEKFNKLNLTKSTNKQRIVYAINFVRLYLNYLIEGHLLGVFNKKEHQKEDLNVENSQIKDSESTINNVQILIDMSKFLVSSENMTSEYKEQFLSEFEKQVKALLEIISSQKELRGKRYFLILLSL